MEILGDKSDQFPPIFNQFRDFFEEQRGVLLNNFEKQRIELFEQFSNVLNEKEEMKKELDNTKKDLKTARDMVEEIDKMENEEIEELEMKLKITTNSLMKKEEAEKELIKAKSKTEELQIKQNITNGIINKLKNDVKEVDYLKEENNTMKLELESLRKEKDVSIEKFKVDLKNLKEQKADMESKDKEDLAILEEEIKDLVNNNQEKEKLITRLVEETEDIKEQITILEIENDEFKNKATLVSANENYGPNLFLELSQNPETLKQFKILKCEVCENTFINKHTLNHHKRKCTEKKYLKQKAIEIEKNFSKQRSNLVKQLFQIKETELHAKYSCNSRCNGTCRIFHQKHNWEKVASENLIQKLNQIMINDYYNCERCERYFDELTELEKHIKITHCVDNCDTTLNIAGDLGRHLQTNHSDAIGECSKSVIEESGWSSIAAEASNDAL